MEKQPNNPYAVVALTLGVVSVFFGMFIVPPIVAIVYGSLGISRATALSNHNVSKTGKGFSVAGLVLGIVYLVLGYYQWIK